uniref:Uncharacterized protein n=1 Tax=Pseudictyota dubia TaxID=2749911 RepID=A0A7R9W622_9STRA|mmetsp:Transcript_34469/g.63700  ORF Transcript_34469/g.63700 Transcript_34469/m.63700 type:complete len:214 (+) Transcript_34469:441-1082(+)
MADCPSPIGSPGARLKRTVSMPVQRSAPTSSHRTAEARAYDSPASMEFFHGIKNYTSSTPEGGGRRILSSAFRRRQSYQNRERDSSRRASDLSELWERTERDGDGALVKMAAAGDDDNGSGGDGLAAKKEENGETDADADVDSARSSSGGLFSWKGRRRRVSRAKSSTDELMYGQTEKAAEWRQWLDTDEEVKAGNMDRIGGGDRRPKVVSGV